MARAKNNYRLPLDIKKITHWHKRASRAHVGSLKHSLDFYAPEGTRIKAAADGEVVWIRDTYQGGGLSKKIYFAKSNLIVIKHKNNEYTNYEHNKYKSAKVLIGQKVKRGQIIAEVGSVGWVGLTKTGALDPELHFEVFTNPSKRYSEGETLQVVFNIPRISRCTRRCYE